MSQPPNNGADDQSWRFINEMDNQLVAKVTAKVAEWLREEIETERERRPIELSRDYKRQ